MPAWLKEKSKSDYALPGKDHSSPQMTDKDPATLTLIGCLPKGSLVMIVEETTIPHPQALTKG